MGWQSCSTFGISPGTPDNRKSFSLKPRRWKALMQGMFDLNMSFQAVAIELQCPRRRG